MNRRGVAEGIAGPVAGTACFTPSADNVSDEPVSM